MRRPRSGPASTQLAGEFDAWARTIHEPTVAQRRQAARTIAGVARDVDECRALLDMLGLHAREGVDDG